MTAAKRRPGLQRSAAARIGRRQNGAVLEDDKGASSGSTEANTDAGILGAIAAKVEAPAAPGEQVINVPVAELAPHPANIRTAVGDITELTASISESGVQQPLIVVTANAFRTANSDLGQQIPQGAGWVVIAGHRRHAAAAAAEVSSVPALVRDHLAGDADSVVSMVLENVLRAGLTPMEESRAFGRLRDAGWSERQISRLTGISPGQVHKRLQLLKLPTELAAALDGGPAIEDPDAAAENDRKPRLTPSRALELLKLPKGDLVAAWNEVTEWRDVQSVVQHRQAAAKAAKEEKALLADLRDRGFDVQSRDALARSLNLPSWQLDRHELENGDGDELPDPRSSVAVIDQGGASVKARFFPRSLSLDDDDADSRKGQEDTPADRDSESRIEAALEQQRQLKEAQDAAAAGRRDACRRLLTTPGVLTPDLASEILVDAVLTDEPFDPYAASEQAMAWCGIEGDSAPAMEDVDEWMLKTAAVGGLAARRAAVAVFLVDIEQAMNRYGASSRGWDKREIRHVRRLVRHAGYVTTDYDNDRIAAGESASAGSTFDDDDQNGHAS
jgi:ParB/RepB/Spo0J family partition protein